MNKIEELRALMLDAATKLDKRTAVTDGRLLIPDLIAMTYAATLLRTVAIYMSEEDSECQA